MMINNLETKIGNILLKSPLLTTSGTSGSSSEVEHFENSEMILKSLGAFTTKSVTLKPRKGNPEPRIVETRSGIINSIGLQNKGSTVFIREELPKLIRYKIPIIVNISAASIEEFGELTDYLLNNDENNLINGIEINVSCPNVKEGGVAFGTNPKAVEMIVNNVRKYAGDFCTIITKLTPNITDVKIPAKAAIHAGSHALSMINTLKAMAIDIDTKKPFLGNEIGGLSVSCNYIVNEAGGAGTAGNDMYFEAMYSFKNFDIFLGAGDGWHTTTGSFEVINVGISTSKEIKITDSFSLPVFGSIIVNPQAELAYVVAGFSF